jgi:hypothetical protein
MSLLAHSVTRRVNLITTQVETFGVSIHNYGTCFYGTCARRGFEPWQSLCLGHSFCFCFIRDRHVCAPPRTAGLQLEAVMDRVKDAISLDHMSRLLADVQLDSSELVDSLLTAEQRILLNHVFNHDAMNRDKVIDAAVDSAAAAAVVTTKNSCSNGSCLSCRSCRARSCRMRGTQTLAACRR